MCQLQLLQVKEVYAEARCDSSRGRQLTPLGTGSFMAQRDHGIDAHSAACRGVASKERDDHEQN